MTPPQTGSVPAPQVFARDSQVAGVQPEEPLDTVPLPELSPEFPPPEPDTSPPELSEPPRLEPPEPVAPFPADELASPVLPDDMPWVVPVGAGTEQAASNVPRKDAATRRSKFPSREAKGERCWVMVLRGASKRLLQDSQA
jgi:hypothetical protein